MDDRALRKLAGAAEHEAAVAAAAADTVDRLLGKVARIERDLAAARDAVKDAKREAKEADQRATAAREAHRAAADGVGVVAAAGVATGSGEAG